MVISNSFGGDASGMVVENIASALSKNHFVDVYTLKHNSLSKDFQGRIYQYAYPKIGVPFLKYLSLSVRLFGKDILSNYVISSILCDIKGRQYDIILSFVYGLFCIGALAGNAVKRSNKIPHFSYFIDPIPAPEGWLKVNSFYKRFKKYVVDFSKDIDSIALSNSRMVEYQKKIIYDKDISVLYTPTSCSNLLNIARIKDSTVRFLYAGSIYGARTPQFLLKAFERLIDVGINAELLFVGTNDLCEYTRYLADNVKERVKIFPRTNDLIQYYEISDVLIDIDADIANDVYLSSKVVNYLAISRPIICQTREGSPSDNLFKQYNTIIQARFSVDSMCESMKRSIRYKDMFNYNERIELLKNFDINTIVRQLEAKLELMVRNNGK